jgi:hypothetical protein
MATVILEEDDEGNLVLPLSDDMLEELGWEIGDTIDWTDNKDGSWSMTKKKETEFVLVEAVSTFRMRYMVEVPVGKADWALDTVVMNEAEEFSQEHLGEHIVSHRVISKEDALALCDADNDYTKTWNDEKKMKVFFTTIDMLED